MARRPRVRVNSQFRPKVATSGRDCGVATTEELIRHGTDGAIILDAGQTRQRMGNLKDWTTPFHVKNAVESIDKEARKRGMKALKYKMAGSVTLVGGVNFFVKGAGKSSIVSRAKRGELIHFVIDYAKVNQKYPWLSGSKTFMGRHSVYAGGFADGKGTLGIRKHKGKWQLRYADPTWNRPGTPSGPKWVNLSIIWDIANGAWSDRGGTGWVGGSTPAAIYLDTPTIPEEPVDPCESRITELRNELEDTLGALADTKAIVKELRAKRISRQLADDLNDIAAQIDSLAPEVEAGDDEVLAGTEV